MLECIFTHADPHSQEDRASIWVLVDFTNIYGLTATDVFGAIWRLREEIPHRLQDSNPDVKGSNERCYLNTIILANPI